MSAFPNRILASLCALLAGFCLLTPASAQDGDHVLAVGDGVAVAVYAEPELDLKGTLINKTGKVSLPLVGEIQMAGLTAEQASRAIEAAYKKGYLVNPKVTVTTVAYAKRKFTMLGAVNKPGSYLFGGGEGVNLLQAIGMAGGYSKAADPSDVTIKRTGKDGRTETIKVDAKKLAKDGNAKAVELQDGDQIFVDESIF
jgi:polysaccharide biosynthesis/export protein